MVLRSRWRPCAITRVGPLTQQVQNDGDVVGRQVPHDVDILAHLTQVQAPRGDVEHVAQLAARNQAANIAQTGVVQEGVPDHQGQSLPLGQLHQLCTLGRRCRQRLFHQHVLAGQQCLPRQGVVSFCRGSDGHRVNAGSGQQRSHRRERLYPRIALLHGLHAVRPQIAHGGQGPAW